MRVCVVGANAELAKPLIRKYDEDGYTVIRVTRPVIYPPAAGPLDALIVMTGCTDDAKIGDMRSEQWHRVLEGCLTVPATALQSVGRYVKNGGNVVVVGSVVGSTGAYGAANYAAAKAGLVGLVRSAALEWATRGVVVNLLELGFIDAGMGARLPPKVKDRVLPTIPLGRFGTEEEFAHAVEFLSTVRYMTGNVLTLAGGLR